ncbi:hypothetical protein [Pseudoduganella chitinolytica]|uniref:DUF5801 domain-containing protein n=1 Tax=Pseudoduganella chitinolytica TaxID=34070 RepID=A0ABY8BJQ8_9BURK|nr:hypothetical protein [Pseudoduganella chitinolytica]WEF35588.1 hypothetical protein PX653_12805 [Pseudoduganella chitinolytica]
MIFAFVTGANPALTIPNLSHGEAILESNIQFSGMLDARAASLDIVQTQQGKLATVQLVACSTTTHSGVSYIDNLNNNTAVAIDNVIVRNSAGTILENSDGSVNTAGLTITFSGGVATVTGVQAGYTIDYHTVADHNRVQVNNTGTGANDASFDIGGFTLLQVANDAAEIGSRMHFEDAGPRIGAALALDTAILNTQDAQTIGPATDTATQSFAAAFALPGVGSNFADQEAILANGLVTLNGTARITDGDGDFATSTAKLDLGGNVRFDDDGPGPFSPASIALINSGNAVVGAAAMLAAASAGADIPGTARFVDVAPADNFLYASDGTTLLKSGGENIVLSGYGSSVLTARTVSGATVFTATLNSVTDQYTIDFDRRIDDGSGVSFLGAAPVRSGNPTYNLIDNVGDTAHDLPTVHTVSISSNGAGVDNQSMNRTGMLGETLRIDFTNGAALSGSPLGSDFVAGTHQTVNGYSFLLSQNTPSGPTGTAYIQVFDADNDKVLVNDPGDVLDTITLVSVNGMTIYDGSFHTAAINGSVVSGMLYNGGIVLVGLSEGLTGDGTGGDDPVIKVSTATGFNRVEVSNFAGQTVNGQLLGGTSFDIAPAGVDQAVAGKPFSFDLPIQVTDFDGDFGPVEVIGVHIVPVPLG